MPTQFETMKALSSEVNTLLDLLINLNREDLFGTKRLSTLSFDSDPALKEPFEITLGLLGELRQCNLDRIPTDQLQNTKNHLSAIKVIFDKAIALKLVDSNPKGQRDAIVNELQGMYPASYALFAPTIAFANKAGTDFKRLERQAQETLTETKAYTDKAKEDLITQKHEAEEIIQAMRTAALESGVSQNSIYYANAEKEHKSLADKWLRSTIAFGIALTAYTLGCIATLILVHGSDKKFEFTYVEVGMVVIFALIAFAVNFSIRQYTNHRHNTVVNSDKARTLATVLAFVKAKDNDAVKDTVLQQASAAAFSPTPSGYLKGQAFLGSPVLNMAQRIAERSLSGPAGHA